jgi:hypothetical protein
MASVHLATAAKAEACRTAVMTDIRNQIEAHVANAKVSNTQLASR